MSQVDLIPGVSITLGKQSFIMPPAGLDVLEANWDKLERHTLAAQAATAPTKEQLTLVIDLVHGALRRNYPDIERAQVASGITLDNLASLYGSAMRQSLPPVPKELRAPDSGEGASPGESPGGVSAPS